MLPRLLGMLPAGIPASFFVTLHTTPHGWGVLPQILSKAGPLTAEHPRNASRVRPGRIYVAPPDLHLLFDGGVMRLVHGPKENGHRPSIDAMFRSAAHAYRERVAGVLLTGNLDDGAAGLKAIQEQGGLAIVQDPKEAPYPDMPKNALVAMEVDYCLPIQKIRRVLIAAATEKRGGRTTKPIRAEKGKNKAFSEASPAVQPKAGTPIPLVCPDCQGPLWEFQEGKLERFQCLVGHRYNRKSLLAAHTEEVEQALWVALRALEERITLQRNLGEMASGRGDNLSSKGFLARAKENEKHARMLRRILEDFDGEV